MNQSSRACSLISLAMCGSLLLALSGCPTPVVSPAIPTGLSVGSATITSLSVGWDDVPDATSCQEYRDTSAAGSFAAEVYDGAAAGFVDSNLTFGGTYYYKVKASNSAGSSPLSEAAEGTTLAFASVANGASNNVSAFTISATSGALTAVSGSPFAVGETMPYSVTTTRSR